MLRFFWASVINGLKKEKENRAIKNTTNEE